MLNNTTNNFRPRHQIKNRIKNARYTKLKENPFLSQIEEEEDSNITSNNIKNKSLIDIESNLIIPQKTYSTDNHSKVKQISHEFDRFITALMITSSITLIVGFLTLSWNGTLVLTFTTVVCLASFYYCSHSVHWIMSHSKGTADMQIIADYIKEGANSYLKTQYICIAWIAIIVSVSLFFIYLFRSPSSSTANVPNIVLAIVTSFSFLIGAFCSAIAGYTGVWISVRVNLRVAAAASKYNYIESFLLAFRGGAVSSILSAAMCISGISILYIICDIIFVKLMNVAEAEIPLMLGGYGFGASFVALFMQLGGGIYTKAADIGADMCGKIEMGIPEDDPRNPAVIADLVGDNVGDCAGSMADVFESIAAEMIGTMILGGSLAFKCNLEKNVEMFIFFPIIIHSLDLCVSIIGIMFTHPRTSKEDAIIPMKRGYTISLILAIISYTIVCRLMLHCPTIAPNAWWHFSLCGFIGLICAYCLVLITQYYTDYIHAPVKRIANASKTGHGTNIIAGIAVGMESTALPCITICCSLFFSYMLGYTSGLPAKHVSGLFGNACATMGMLCTAVYVLSMNNFGPIADNAGGLVEMSNQPYKVRVITDRLDAVGNVTKAATKGYAVGGSALACFLLFQAFLDEIQVVTKMPDVISVDITKVEVMIGGLLGIMMVFLFTGWSIEAVGRTAEKVVVEVRRQFREIDGIMEHKAIPEYGKCVEIVTKAALKEMIKPAMLALVMPVAVGLIFRFVGYYRGQYMLGVEVLASFLMFGTLTGLMMAIFLDNSGGAWDNAKKLIEAKNLKGSEEHKAAVTGDTVGDPFKDTAGPALHVVITTMSTTALVLAPLFIAYASSPET